MVDGELDDMEEELGVQEAGVRMEEGGQAARQSMEMEHGLQRKFWHRRLSTRIIIQFVTLRHQTSDSQLLISSVDDELNEPHLCRYSRQALTSA